MKIYAKQVPYDYQDSSWIIDNDFYYGRFARTLASAGNQKEQA